MGANEDSFENGKRCLSSSQAAEDQLDIMTSAKSTIEPDVAASNTSKLLLLTAKAELDERDQALVRDISKEDIDWQRFVDVATAKFSIPYAFKHLRSIAADIVPDPALRRMRGLSGRSGLATMKITVAQLEFHKTCIAPIGAKHVYLKGVALSTQIGSNLTDRFCRDVDVLIANKDIERVIKLALKNNYRIASEAETLTFAETTRDQRFITRFADVVTLISPDNAMIEVHRKLTKLSLKFNIEKIFSTADTINVSGVEMRTLSYSMHFVYICYHHSRHFWSRLHWLADIDGFIRSDKMSRKEALETANEVGILPTIEATFAFHDLIRQPNLWENQEHRASHGGQYLSACLANLSGGLEVEQELRKSMTLGDFMSSWQVSESRYKELWFYSWLHRIKPSVSQHYSRRYPAYLVWLYYVENVYSLAKNAVLLTFNRKRRAVDKPPAN